LRHAETARERDIASGMAVAAHDQEVRRLRDACERLQRAAHALARILGAHQQENAGVGRDAATRPDVLAVYREPRIEHAGIDRVVDDRQSLPRKAEALVDFRLYHARD